MFKLITVIFVCLLFKSYAHAYVGPGMGGGLITATLGIIIAIFAAIFALLWFPIKKFFKKKRENDLDQQKQENKVE